MALPGTRQYLDFEDTSSGLEAGYQSPLSAGYNTATQAGGMGADQYYSVIKDYVANTLGNADLTEQQRSENIRNAAAQYGVSNEDISRATGYGLDVVGAYLDPNRFRSSTVEDSTASNTGANVGALAVATGTTPTGVTTDQVTSLYDTLLNRAPDDAGLDYWMNSGLSVNDIRDRFLQSDEYLGLQGSTGADTLDTTVVDTTDTSGAKDQTYYDNINNYVTNVLTSDMTGEEKAANIANAAQTYGVSNEDIAKATGYSLEDVNKYLSGAVADLVTTDQGALTQAAADTAAAKADTTAETDKVVDYRGKEYDKNTLLKLAGQIIPNLGSLSGGAFSTTGSSIGFDYDEAKRLLGKDPTSVEQVILDIARQMIDKGVTDISQLQVKDITSDLTVSELVDEFTGATGRYVVNIPTGNFDESGEQYISRELTPEEIASITSETLYDPEGGQYIRKTANDILTGKGIYLGDNLLSQAITGLGPLTMHVGGTATGKGSTEYQLVVNPNTGKLEFSTYANDSSPLGAISAMLTVASFIPGVGVFAQIANAAIAASQGNTIGALASLAGAGGYSNVATALNVANAVDKGNVTGIVTSLLANPTVANAAGTTMLTDTISLSDVGSAINIVDAANKGDIAGVLAGASKLTNSPDLQTAATAVNVIKAVESGNLNAIANAAMQFGSTIAAADKLNDKTTVDNIVKNVNDATIADSGEDDLGAAAYVSAKASGATDEEAMAASKAVTDSIAATGGDTKVTAETGDTKTDIMSGVTQMDMGEFAGLDEAIKAATERNTLNIGNADADDLDQAAALAGARGFTNFTYNGKTYALSASSQQIAAQAVAADIASAKNFSEAYKIARANLGAGQVFEWNGKKFSTDTREENPSLAAASDQIRYAQLGAGGGRGSYEGYDAKAAADALSKINTSALATDTGDTGMFGTMDDFLKSAGLGGDYVVVGDKISKDLVDPFVKTIGVATRAAGSFLDNMAGGLQSVNVIDKNSMLVRAADSMKTWGADRMGSELLNSEKAVIDRVNNVEGFGNKFTELGRALWDNPTAIFTLGANEGVEEIVPILAGVGAAKWVGKIGALGVDAFMNAWEAGGANYNDTKEAAQKAGMSEADSHLAAQKSAAGAGAVAAVLGPVADMPFIKKAGSTATSTGAGAVTKAATREAVTEYPEEGAASLMSDYFATGTVDVNKAMTQATIGSVLAGKTVGTFEAVSNITQSGPATTEILQSGAVPAEQAAVATQAIDTALQNNTNLVKVGNDIVTAMTASGMNTAQAQTVANTAVAEQVVNNLTAAGGEGSQFSIPDLNVAVGHDGQGNAVTLGDVIGSSVTGFGTNNYVSPDIVVGTNAEGKPVTVGDLTGLQAAVDKATGATTGAATGATTGAATDTTTGKTTDVKTDTATGATTTTTTDQSTGTTTQTTVNQNTGVNTQTTTDQNTGTTTETTSDTNTGTNTQVATDTNTNTTTTTTTNTNTNTTTQTTVNNNTNTTTTVNTDTNGNVTTEVVTDSNNNTETTTTYDTNTNTSTTVTVDTSTNTVIDTVTNVNVTPPKVDPVPTVTPEVKEEEETEEEKKKKAKKKAKALTSGAGAGLMMGDEITGLDPTILSSFVTGEKKLDPLARVKDIQQEMERDAMMQNIDPRLAAVLSERLGIQEPQGESLSGLETLAKVLTGTNVTAAPQSGYYAYGKEDSIDDIMGPAGGPVGFADGGYVQPLMADGGMALPLLAKTGGGLPKQGGREDFRHGKHVAGEGDGQSDDIPAWLADGEFVFPADVVAALGNGSSKAGTDKLYEMMHNIRERARSTGKKDLPPPALKSPLDYLKSKR